ncbi:MAG: AMP-binding protein, partial [Deltaproteobacteria bacterium]|nr:AMP-binding protein [Deltaproteobacteria bacterium]
MNATEHAWYAHWPEDVPKNLDPELFKKPLGTLLDDMAKSNPDNPAVIFLDTTITYRQLNDYVDRFATSLKNMGVKKGDVIAVRLPNSIHFVITFFAAMKLGAIITANNPLYKAAEVEHQFCDSGAKVEHQFCDSGAKILVVMDLVYEEAGRALPKTPVKTIIGCNIADFLPTFKRILGKLLGKVPSAPMPANALSFMDMLKISPDVPKVEFDTAEDLAVLQYTGGTTGLPKGAMLTHMNLMANAQQVKSWDPKSQPGVDVIGGVLPL